MKRRQDVGFPLKIGFWGVMMILSAQFVMPPRLFAYEKREIEKALEIFVEKPVKDARDPFIQALLKNQAQIVVVLKQILLDMEVRSHSRAWAAFIPSLMLPDLATSMVPELAQCLSDPYWRVRMNAVNTLGTIRDKRAASALVKTLSDQEPWVRDAAENALSKMMSEEFLDFFEKQIVAGDEDVQKRLANLLGESELPSRNSLLWLLFEKGKNADVRRASLYHLGPHIHEKLPSLINDPSSCVRKQVIELIGRKKIVSALPALRSALKDESLSIRTLAIQSLNDIHTQESLDAIATFLALPQTEITFDQILAFMVLSLDGREDLLEYGKKIIESPAVSDYFKAYALYGLSGIRTRESLAYLLRVEKEGSAFLRNVARSALWKAHSDNARQGEKDKSLNCIKTWNSTVYSDEGNSSLYNAAILMEYIFHHYHTSFLKVEIENAGDPMVVYLFKDRTVFKNYARQKDQEWPFLQDSGAYYVPSRKELITYGRENSSLVARTLFHETLHHVLSQHAPRAPVWFNEGAAEYFSHFHSDLNGYETGKLAPKHLSLVKKNLLEGQYTPLSYLIQLDHFAFRNDRFGPCELSHYAQSWSLVYFLAQAEGGSYAPILKRYVSSLLKGEDPVASFLDALSKNGLDLESLHKKWEAYFLILSEQDLKIEK